ncbi:glycosyltransferase [Pseudomonas tolaasii]|uniref:glycosyltransferase n=1 Tax=Pseudomonas tolaasii TaxID=29442 RepID=UPI001C59FD2B|nr:glycosyltransferase [Pseudomonas tolaasii]MBW1248164.1 glycosyltransferase [Pseudomonas tolaasii]
MTHAAYKLSVLLVTYNHEKYIREALDGLFRQVLDEKIELVIADDGSSDNTLAIIREYEGKDARFVFNFLEFNGNLGITKNYQRSFAACAGEYIAVLEGDDYWCSPLKLVRQIEFLENHWECSLCSVNYLVYEEDRSQFTPRIPAGTSYKMIGARDLIADNLVGNFSTCLYRKSALDALPPALFDIRSYDWIVNICISRSNLIGFLEEPMSVYRLHSKGVWTQTSHVNQLKIQLEVIPAYDALTNHVFHYEFEVLASRLRHVIASSQVEHAVEAVVQPVVRALPGFIDYIPQFVMRFLRAVMPVRFKRALLKALYRRSS